jgi:hypothetical protein
MTFLHEPVSFRDRIFHIEAATSGWLFNLIPLAKLGSIAVPDIP